MAANTTHVLVGARQPEDGSIKVWRYMDLPKLIDFLQTKSLYFAPITALKDSYEGTFPEGSVEQEIAIIQEEYPWALVREIRRDIEFTTELDRENVCVNWGNAGATESAPCGIGMHPA